jgi:outer membrane protein assembly factor BamA
VDAFCGYGIKPGSRGLTRAKNYVDSMTFGGPVDLSGAELQQVVTSLKAEEFEREPNWLERVQDSLRQPWLDHGYHKVVEVTAKAAPVGGDDGRYAITAHLDEGFQYRLGRINFRADSDADFEKYESSAGITLLRQKTADSDEPGSLDRSRPVFSPEELRSLMPLRDGDIFNNRQIREGLNALNEFYGEHGYINFVAQPITDVDEQHQIISPRIDLLEGRQFHIGKTEVWALDPSTRNALIWNMKTGDVFNNEKVHRFFDDNKSNCPAGSYRAKDPEMVSDLKTSTVDINFTFVSCPGR